MMHPDIEKEASLVFGNGKWATKTNKVLGYKRTANGKFAEREIDVTRASTKYITNKAGILVPVASGVLGVDYASDPEGAALVEPAATNLLLRSEEFNDAYWSKLNVTVSGNAAAAPTNATTADEVIENAATGFFKTQSPTFASTAGVLYPFSIHVKKTTRRYFRINAIRTATVFASVVLDLDTGLIVDTRNTTSQARFDNIRVDLVNGFYRLSGAASRNSNGNLEYAFGFSDISTIPTDNEGFNSFTSAGGSAGIVWGAQLETGSTATSYIPTLGATASRNADVISKTGISDLIGQSEGTLYAEVDWTDYASTEVRNIFVVGDATTNNRIGLGLEGTNQRQLTAIAINGADITASQAAVAQFPQGKLKLCLGYDATGVQLFINGVPMSFSAKVGSYPSLNYVGIGNRNNGQFFNDRINSAAVIKTRKSNQTLQEWTTL